MTDVRTILKKMPYTVRVGNIPGGLSEFITIQAAIDYCDQQAAAGLGAEWVIQVWPGDYNEGDITPAGNAEITIKGMGDERVEIAPVIAPAAGVIVSGHTLTLQNFLITAPTAAMPALRVTGGACIVRECAISGVNPGDAIQQIGGRIDIFSSGILEGDIDLRTGACNFNIYHSNILGGPIDTAAEALAHTIWVDSCYLHLQDINSLATGATTCTVTNCTYVDTVTNAGTGLFVLNGCSMNYVNQTNAAGTTILYSGYLYQVTRAVGSVVWWLNGYIIKVLPSNTITDGMIEHALAAATAAARRIEIRLAPGEYEEDNLALADDCIIIGAGHTMASGSHITINSANPIFTAGAVQANIRHLRITQAGAGDCFVINNAAAVVHTDDIVFGSTAGNAVTMTAGTYSAHNSTSNDADFNLSAAACTLTLHRCSVVGGDIVTAGAFAHIITLESLNMNGGNITNVATGVGSTTTIEIIKCFDITAFTDASQLGTVLIEASLMVTATKTGTSPWIVRIAEFGTLSNENATGAITCYQGLIFALTRAIGPIVWWQDTNTLRVIPCTTVTDTIIQWAVNAAGAGDTIVIHPGTYQEEVVLAAGINLQGIDREGCLLNLTPATATAAVTLITMAAACRVAGLTLTVTGDATGNGTGIECNDVSCTIEDLHINLVRTGNNVYGISEQTGGTAAVILVRNIRLLSDTDTNEFGFWCDQAGKTIHIEECKIQGGDIGVGLAEDSIIYMRHNHVEANARPLGAGSAIYTNHADAIIRMSGDTIEGMIYRVLGTITYKNANQQYEVWQGAYDSVAATTLHHGMLIQDAINAAAAETPAPGTAVQTATEVLGYVTYTILIHPGIYDEVVTMSTWVNLKGIGPKGSVVIAQNDAIIITGADNIEIADLTIRLTNSTDVRPLFYDNTANCTIRLTNLVMEIVADFTDAHRLFFLSGGGGDYTIERCSAIIGVTNVGFATIYINDTVTLHLNNNDFSAVAGDHIWCHSGATITGLGNRWVGVAAMFDVTAGTITLDNDAMICTGAWTTMTGFTMMLRNCAIEAPVVAGNLATVRMKNCSYRAISRTGTGNIVDESPVLKDAPWKVHRWTWQAALANAQVAVRGTPLDAGSGQVLLEVIDNATESEAVEQLGEAAGSLANEFTPDRTPRFLTQISVDSFDAHVYMFFGLRHVLSDYVPVATEDHAGFIWDGINFMASSDDGGGILQTNLTIPTVNTHVQLEVIVFGGVTAVGWVEFYIDGVLVATHTTRIPVLGLDWQHLLEADSSGDGDEIDVTVRTGGVQECPA